MNVVPGSSDVGILGTGRMGVRLALIFAEAGRSVVLGSRDPARAATITQKPGQKNIVGEQPTLRILLAAVAILRGVTLVIVGPKKRHGTGSA
jgi:predicted dinucleotide-binding enzyme